MKKIVLASLILTLFLSISLPSGRAHETPAPTPTQKENQAMDEASQVPQPSPRPIVPEKGYVTNRYGNPYMPLWEHVPDGEPHLFHDPDNPGKMRVYVYGSHDTERNFYCGRNQVVWSAPEDDLKAWRYEGVSFVSDRNRDGDIIAPPDILWAPDACEVPDPESPTGYSYYLYPFVLNIRRRTTAAKAYRPEGPFHVINWSEDDPNATVGVTGGDPAVLVDTDGKVYAYWGDYPPTACEIDPENMYMNKGPLKPHHIGHHSHNDQNPFRFFEASSIRKIGKTYVFIYERLPDKNDPYYTGACDQFVYAWSLNPMGPWNYGGLIVSTAGEMIPDGNGGYTRTFFSNNTHGGIEKINGQWYLFYHRTPNVKAPEIFYFSRQAMAEPIHLEYNEETGKVKIDQVQMTSNGFAVNGLDPFEKTPFGIACFATGNYHFERVDDPAVDNMPLVDLQNGTVIGIKHFNFEKHAPEGKTTYLEVGLVPQRMDADIEVLLRSPDKENTPDMGKVIGTIHLSRDMTPIYTKVRIPVPAVDLMGAAEARQGLFFRIVNEEQPGQDLCELHDLRFLWDVPGDQSQQVLEAEEVRPRRDMYKEEIRINGKPLKLPKWSSVFTISLDPADGMPEITAKATEERTKINIIPPETLPGTGFVAFEGARGTHTYVLRFSVQHSLDRYSGTKLPKGLKFRPERGELTSSGFAETMQEPRRISCVPLDFPLPQGDWQMTVNFKANAEFNWQIGMDNHESYGIQLRGTEDRFLQFFVENTGDQMIQVYDSQQSIPGNLKVSCEGNEISLRLTRRGNMLEASYSNDRQTFTRFKAFPLPDGFEAPGLCLYASQKTDAAKVTVNVQRVDIAREDTADQPPIPASLYNFEK